MQNNAQYEENCRYEFEVWKGSIHVANVAFNYFFTYKIPMIVLYHMMKIIEFSRITCISSG